MLEGVAANGHEDVISWQPHGKAFRVHKPPEFATRVMACYFKQTQYKSFQRQLHIYGFRRITGKGMLDNGAYYHEQFIRGQKHGSLRMIRDKIKCNKKELSDWHSHSDPDFYARNSIQQQQLGRGGGQDLASEIGIIDQDLSRPPTTAISTNEIIPGWATEPNTSITGKGMLDNGAYYHEQFIRGQRHGSLRMIRDKIKCNKKEPSGWHSHSDPDCYARNSIQQQQLGRGGGQALASEIGIIDQDLSRPPTTAISTNETIPGWATEEPNTIFSSRGPANNSMITESQITSPSCTIESNSEVTSSSLPGPIMDLLLHDGDEAFFEGMRFFCASSARPTYCAHKNET
jgi:hypothetical protein